MQYKRNIGQAYPGLRVLLPLLLGIGLSAFQIGGIKYYGFLLLMLMVACVVLELWTSRHDTNRFIMVWTSVFTSLWVVLGFVVGSFSTWRAECKFPEAKQGYQVLLLTQPRETEKTVRAEALVLTRFSEDSLWRPAEKVQLSVWKDTASLDLSVGDMLFFYSSISPLRPSGNPYEFDYAAYLKRSGIVGQIMLFQNQWKVIPENSKEYAILYQSVSWSDRARLFFLRLRQSLVNQLREDGLQGEAFSVYAALAMGEKAFLSSETEELYSRTGTTHVLALSGMHLGILMFVFYYAFSHGLKYTRWKWLFGFLAFVLIWAYTLLAGMPVSLVRASIMYSFSIYGMMIHRRGFTLNILFWTASLMLLADPDTLYDVGFQLSFAAMSGILVLQKRIETLFRFRWMVLQNLWSGIAVSLAAQVATFPLVVYYFHYVATTSVWATLILSFLSLFLLYALPVYLLCFPVKWIALPLLQGISLLIESQHRVLHWFSTWPNAVLGPYYISWSEVIFIYLGLIAGITFLMFRRKLLPALALVIFIFGFILVHEWERRKMTQSFPLLVFYNNYRAPSVHIIFSRNQNYLLQTHKCVDWRNYAYIKGTFWDRFTDDYPVVLSQKSYSDNYLINENGLLFTRNFCLGFLHGEIPENVCWGSLKRLDYLFLSRGFQGDLEHVLQQLSPEMVVLDASLTDSEHKKYLHLCVRKQWIYHDMRRKGALKVAF